MKAAPPLNVSRVRRAWSESDEDEPLQRQSEPEHVVDMQESDAEGASDD